MNWTGGRLQRHSRASNNNVIKRQKEYFAKARAKGQHSQLDSAEILLFPSFLRRGHRGEGDDALHIESIPSIQHSSSPSERARLREYREPSQGVNHLEPEPSAGYALVEATQDSHSRKRETTINKHRSSFTAEDSGAVLAINLQRPTKTAGSLGQSKCKSPENATPAEDTLARARRKLLRQSDWLKLLPSRPLHMTFPSTHGRWAIGRRRRVLRSPMISNRVNHLQPEHRCQSVSSQHTQSHKISDPVRIRIGTDALASEQSTSSHDQPLKPASDGEMLLEAEDSESEAASVLNNDHTTSGTELHIKGETFPERSSPAASFKHNVRQPCVLSFLQGGRAVQEHCRRDVQRGMQGFIRPKHRAVSDGNKFGDFNIMGDCNHARTISRLSSVTSSQDSALQQKGRSEGKSLSLLADVSLDEDGKSVAVAGRSTSHCWTYDSLASNCVPSVIARCAQVNHWRGPLGKAEGVSRPLPPAMFRASSARSSEVFADAQLGCRKANTCKCRLRTAERDHASCHDSLTGQSSKCRGSAIDQDRDILQLSVKNVLAKNQEHAGDSSEEIWRKFVLGDQGWTSE